MNNSLLVENYIYDAVSPIIQNTFPVVAEQSTTYPYCVYRRTGMTTLESKDGYSNDRYQFEITIYDKSYKNTLTLLNQVRDAIQKEFRKGGTRILNFSISTSLEDWASDTYIQLITYDVEVAQS